MFIAQTEKERRREGEEIFPITSSETRAHIGCIYLVVLIRGVSLPFALHGRVRVITSKYTRGQGKKGVNMVSIRQGPFSTSSPPILFLASFSFLEAFSLGPLSVECDSNRTAHMICYPPHTSTLGGRMSDR